MQNMLRPIVEAAGYRVVGEDDKGVADIAIVSHDTSVAKDEGSRIIRLRSEPEAAGKKDESIYRYDRAGLLMALKSAAGGKGR
jgi:two-component system chemotaxis sensor kinase CheA